MNLFNQNINPENILNNVKRGYCSKFGCGKKLTLAESLRGDRCINHYRQEIDPTLFIQFPNKSLCKQK